MVAIPLNPASSPIFAGSAANPGNAFINALQQSGQQNTNTNIPNNSSIQGPQTADLSTPDPGQTDNASNSVNTNNPQSGSTLGSQFEVQPGAPQWQGQSIRAPMSSFGTPKQGNNSKNIFFKFANQDIPAIWMFINPNQLVINHNKKIQEQMTRGGFVLFHWGDALDEISATGLTGSFARINCPSSNTNMKYTGSQPDIGLDRRDTWPYLRFMQLLALYRNNGISTATVSGGSSGGRVSGGFSNQSNPLASAFSTQANGGPSINKQGTNNSLTNSVLSGQVAGARNQRPVFTGIELQYDDHVFTGYFSSFVWTERAEEPFKFTFDFKFTVLTTVYNRVFAAVAPPLVPTPPTFSRTLLGNFQIPRQNSL